MDKELYWKLRYDELEMKHRELCNMFAECAEQLTKIKRENDLLGRMEDLVSRMEAGDD